MLSPRRPPQGLWDMHELLFHRQKALEKRLGPEVAAFGRDRASSMAAGRIRRDVNSGLASGRCVHAADDMVGQRGRWSS